MHSHLNAAEERSRSIWMGTSLPRQPALSDDTETDILVIGSGIAGLSAAYEMVKLGKTVVVLERGALAQGMTARTTAHLTWELDDYYFELIDKRGADAARQYCESQKAAVDRIEAIARAEGIDCDFTRIDGFWVLATPDDRDALECELKAARSIGMDCLPASAPRGFAGEALKFPGQARFHPLKYLAGLVEALERQGARLFEESPLESIEETSNAVIAVANGKRIRARQAIVATNSPINDRVAIHTKQAPYRTYVIAAAVPKGAVEDALIWDTLDPYHYVRIQPALDHDVLIVGGEDHKTGLEDDAERRIAALDTWARAHFPEMGKLTHAWSGQIYEPVDCVPHIGLNPGSDNVYVITGDSGQGMTSAVAGALVIRDLVVNGESGWAEVYEPSRKPLKATGTFLRENVDMATNLPEHLTGGEIDDAGALAPGTGGLLRAEGRKIAAYRDEQGALHMVSATCTHMGCIVHFNSFEKCWDCPCHGSQFSIDGEVLAGPANTPLEAVDAPVSPRRRKAESARPRMRP